MRPTLVEIIAGLFIVIGGLGLLTCGAESCGKRQVAAAVQTANINRGEANAHQSDAINHDRLAQALQQALAGREAELDRLRAEVRRLSAPIVGSDLTPGGVPLDADSPADLPSVSNELPALAVAQDALIRAQDAKIKGLEAEAAALTMARDDWKKTAQAREREAAGLRIALDAQRHVQTASEWRYGLSGFAAGLVLGYAAPRR